MMTINCEELEQGFSDLSRGQVDPQRRAALEEHRRTCPHCRQFSADTMELRLVLSELPKLETSPQFIFNLKREIHRMEGGQAARGWSFSLFPHPLALTSGFALAILLGYVLFQPATSPVMDPANMASAPDLIPESVEAPSVAQEQVVPQVITPPATPQVIRPMTAAPQEQFLLTQDAVVDTARHRLPETPGTDSIPIPVQDDLWRMNQVSTTPGGP